MTAQADSSAVAVIRQGIRLSDYVQENHDTASVRVFCDVGVLPLEWPRDARNNPRVTDAGYTEKGKLIPGSQVNVRNIETAGQRQGGAGAPSLGYMDLNPLDRSHPGETDAQFIERVEDWLNNSDDYRINRYNVSIQRGKRYPMPFDGWDRWNLEAIAGLVLAQMEDSPEENLDRLVNYCGYEMHRAVDETSPDYARLQPGDNGGPRAELLKQLDLIAAAVGEEDSDTEVADDSYAGPDA